jgi:hypothetical protein
MEEIFKKEILKATIHCSSLLDHLQLDDLAGLGKALDNYGQVFCDLSQKARLMANKIEERVKDFSAEESEKAKELIQNLYKTSEELMNHYHELESYQKSGRLTTSLQDFSFLIG